MDNLSEQCEELEALRSIYGDLWKLETETNCYSIEINRNVKLYITLHENYPSHEAPHFELLAPVLDPKQKSKIVDEFRNIHENGSGGPILYQWIEKLREIVAENCEQTDSVPEVVPEENNSENPPEKYLELKVTHGGVIQDRKSAFQGHACAVNSPEDTKLFLNYLLENKKIAQATHNIYAYRILKPDGKLLQDCDDDGETHAGGRLLHLLQILNLQNVMVVVSRWYGGILLGPDRFKHINNAARQVLVQAGFLPNNTTS